MPTVYDKEKIRRLFMEYEGDLDSIMAYKGMPSSKKTLKKYAEEGKWYEELTKIRYERDGLTRLEEIRSNIYLILTSGQFNDQNNMELKPKTYTEALKCYLDVDLRIDEKLNRLSDSKLGSWEGIFRDCIISG